MLQNTSRPGATPPPPPIEELVLKFNPVAGGGSGGSYFLGLVLFSFLPMKPIPVTKKKCILLTACTNSEDSIDVHDSDTSEDLDMEVIERLVQPLDEDNQTTQYLHV